MEKAYDIKDLLVKLKGRGLDMAEEAAVIVLKETFQWLKESAEKSANPYDNMGMLVLPQIEKVIFPLVDKIDGEVG